MIRNYQNNVVIDFNLDPIYRSLNSLKNVVADIESLTTLSSLNSLSSFTSLSSFDSAISNLSYGLSTLNNTFINFTINEVDNIYPSILSNSSNIASLSSSLLSLQSSLSDLTNLTELTSLTSLTGYGNEISILNSNTAALQQSCSNLNDSFESIKTLSSLSDLTSLSNFGNDISILSSSVLIINSSLSQITNSLITITSGGGGIYTDSTYNPQAFSTTLNLNSEMFYTGYFGLNSGSVDGHNPDEWLYGNWDLRQIKRHDLHEVSVYSLENLKMDNFEMYSCVLEALTNCQFDRCGFMNCSIANPIMLNFNGCDELFGGLVSGVSVGKFDCKEIQNNTFSNINSADINCFSFDNNTITNTQNSTDFNFQNVKYDINCKTFEENSFKDLNGLTVKADSFVDNTMFNSSFVSVAKHPCIDLNCITLNKNSFRRWSYGNVVADQFLSNSLESFYDFTVNAISGNRNAFKNFNFLKYNVSYNANNQFSGISSLSMFNCKGCSSFTFESCSDIEFDKCAGVVDCTFNDIYNQILFKNMMFPTNTTQKVGHFGRVDDNYTCTLIFDNCYCGNDHQTATSLFTKLFDTLHSGARIGFKFK